MFKKQTYPEDYLRMVLVGRTGAGKSAVGNTILMERGFESSGCSFSVTKVCQRESGKVQGQKLEVIDTPGLFNTELSNERVTAEIANCIAYASPGPHVFLIILKAERFTKEEEETVEILQNLFGEQAARYTMALFTRGDDLEADGVTIEDVICKNQVLRAFLHQCKGGYHVFNNRNKDPAQVHELLKKINTIVKRNGGRCYTNEMFQEAEKAVEEKKREERKRPLNSDETSLTNMSKEQTYPEDYLRMVLVGKTGTGKSAVGNTILMKKEKVFPSSACADSLTKVCRRESEKVQGQKLEVIDTPGLFDTELSNEQVKAEISKCIAYASPGPHVFLIILKADRFTTEEEETVAILQKLFGEQAACYTMALFTRGDDLEADGVTIEDVIGKNKVLRAFLHQCKGGYHVFNNRNEDPAQVHELLKKINTMVEKNGGRYYTNEMFQEAEKAVEEKRNELLKKSNTMVERNPRRYCTGKRFQRAEKAVEKKKNELLEKSNTMVERTPRSYYNMGMFQEAEKAVEKKKNELLKEKPQRDRDDARSEAKEYVAVYGGGFSTLIAALTRSLAREEALARALESEKNKKTIVKKSCVIQ